MSFKTCMQSVSALGVCLRVLLCLAVFLPSSPAWSLAPSTRFSAKSPVTILNESQEFKRRTQAILDAWIEGLFTDHPGAFSHAMRDADQSARSAIENSQ